MRCNHRSVFAVLLAGLVMTLTMASNSAAPRAQAAVTRAIALSNTSAPLTGSFTPSDTTDLTQAEFPGQIDTAVGPGPYPGTIVNRSLSTRNEHGESRDGESVNSGEKAKSHPRFDRGFEGLNLYQQRYARGGNQFTVEPPDQGLCVGNGYVLETVNSVVNVFNTFGQPMLPDNTATNIVAGFPRDVNHAVDINSFYGYAPAIDRITNIRGPFVTDPSCLFDRQTQRWFVAALTLETYPNGAFTFVNHLDIAVSQTANPTGLWNIYKVDVTNDGSSNPDPSNACPCLGDYPHIGADAHGFYVTTNAYPWVGNGFNGAQIYAFSKVDLAAGAGSVTMVHLDTFGMVSAPSDAGSTQPGFTVWPAQSPGSDAFNIDDENGGIEYFLSSNAADEATRPISGAAGPRTSTQLIVWKLSNTSSLDADSPSLTLSNKVLTVGLYAIPPSQKQPGSGSAPGSDVPQGFCLNNETTITVFAASHGCWRGLVSAQAHARGPEVISRPDSNDTRMQQVMYANGKLWGALDTALSTDGEPQRAGIAWYIVNPAAGKIIKQGYLGATGYDFTYPAIGATASGRGVMAFTATGDALYPSAAYAPIDAKVGVGPWSVVPGGEGATQDDGFTDYHQQRIPVRARWGDYGAAAVDGNAVWIASEYIAHACTYTNWGGPFFVPGSGDNLLGTCGGVSHGPGGRAALANWSTRISKFTP